MVGGAGNGSIEGVEEGGVEGSEGELVDYVGKVECCLISLVIIQYPNLLHAI